MGLSSPSPARAVLKPKTTTDAIPLATAQQQRPVDSLCRPTAARSGTGRRRRPGRASEEEEGEEKRICESSFSFFFFEQAEALALAREVDIQHMAHQRPPVLGAEAEDRRDEPGGELGAVVEVLDELGAFFF